MKKLLKENIAIAAAIALPLLLVIVFILSMSISKVIVDDPRHDFLIATNYYHNNNNNALAFDVIGNELKITYRYKQENENNYHNNKSRLWRIHVADMSVEEIALPLPDQEDGKKSVRLNISGITKLRVINQQPGPDGYIFENSNSYRHGNIMTELFSYDRHYTNSSISKSGRTIPIKGLTEPRYRYNTRFIGWILEEE